MELELESKSSDLSFSFYKKHFTMASCSDKNGRKIILFSMCGVDTAGVEEI